MSGEFDAFRIKITAQYIDLARKKIVEIENNMFTLTQMLTHISATFDKVDWKIINDAEEILRKGNVVVQDFQAVADSFKSEYKRSVQDKIALLVKYESLALWAKMISEANTQLKDEFIRSQNGLRVNFEAILEVLDKELKKDLNFTSENN